MSTLTYLLLGGETANLRNDVAAPRATPDDAIALGVRFEWVGVGVLGTLGPRPPQMHKGCILYLLSHVKNCLPELVVAIAEP